MVTHLRFWLAIASLSLVWIAGLSSVPPRDSLGIAPQDEGYYKPSVMKCKDGSKKFTREQLNDDFCDCQDGTDEPGTSACPDGKFYCQNAGHVPLTIFSSRVNDGICDCCDGSDEYDGKTNCPNTCWEAGKVARERLKKKIATYKDGVIMRKQEVEKAKQAFIKDEEELSKLKNEESILKGLVQKLKEHKERIEKVEEEERRKKEEEKSLKEAEKKAGEQDEASKDSPHDDELEGSHGKLSESLHQDASEDSHDNQIDWSPETEIPNNEKMEEQVVEDHDNTFVESETDDGAGGGEASPLKGEKHVPKNVDGIIGEVDMDDGTESNDAASAHEAEQELEGLANTEGLSREELGQLVASRWTGENAAKKTNEIDNTAKDGKHEAEQDTDNVKQEYDDGYSSEADEDKYKYDDDVTDDVSDEEYEEDHVRHDGSYDPVEDDKADFLDSTSNSQSWLGKIQQSVQNIFQTFNLFRKPVNISEAAHVRKEYEDSSSKLSKIQSRISRLTEKLKHDYGKEKDFYSFYDQCFESEQNKYVYKVCPFKQASQVEGHATTQLGHWDKFEDSYRVMLFSRGDRCWNGPDRSLKVKLRCGLKNELTDIDEPSRCEYVALLSTPLLCLEEKLKELQQKLEQMNSSQPLNHDEL